MTFSFAVKALRRAPRTAVSLLAVLCSLSSAAADSIAAWCLQPEFHGTVRARWELDTRDGYSRFQVRNARLSARANVGIFSAFVQTDLCDAGKMKILDAYASAAPGAGLDFRLGQFRMPFGEEPFLSPATYLFANRSFMGKDMCNVRAVGFQTAWNAPGVPFRISGGVFNPCTITEHSKWTRSYAASAKAQWSPGDWRLSAGVMTTIPDSVRANLVDAALRWTPAKTGWTFDAEYMYKRYARHAHRAAHAWLLVANLQRPLNHKVFNRWSAQLRQDGITAHSSGWRDKDGKLYTTRPLTNRVTAGATLSHFGYNGLKAHLRLNYEKYFYGKNKPINNFDNDKLVAEVVVTF